MHSSKKAGSRQTLTSAQTRPLAVVETEISGVTGMAPNQPKTMLSRLAANEPSAETARPMNTAGAAITPGARRSGSATRAGMRMSAI